jgi:hypothetical protein
VHGAGIHCATIKRLPGKSDRAGWGLAWRPMRTAGEEAGGEPNLVADKKPETQTEET